MLFGQLGDLVGRKFTFLITMLLMGVATFLVGVLPNYAAWGIAAPIALVFLRLLQGLAIGGEYGGAAIYVAEHAPPHQRGLHTSWVQTTAGLGLLLSLLVIVALRTIMGEEAFVSWGWRLPFLFSVALLGVSLWIRLSLKESPLFLEMKKEGRTTKAPLKDTFSNWPNVKLMLIALIGLVAGTAVIQFTGLFYSMIFLTQILKLESGLSATLLSIAIIIGIPFSVLFGALSDYIGRKPVIMGSYVAAILLFFPLFHGLTNAVNPALVDASTRSPVVVVADSGQCSVQFNPLGARKLQSSCDIVKTTLAKLSIPYANEEGEKGALAYVRIGCLASAPMAHICG